MSDITEKSIVTNKLQSDSLGVFDVVFLVLAAVAPLTGVIVIACLGIALGNGGGMVGSFILVTIALLMFGVGYAEMSKKLIHAGGFYAFVLKGLGRPSAMAAALVAMLGYNFFVAGAVGTSGFYMAITVNAWTGIPIPWFGWSLISVVAAFICTRQGIAFSAKVLGLSLILEVLILVIFDIAVLFKTGFSFDVVDTKLVFGGSMGLGLLFAANAFVGVEATGLFGEEARDPKKTIPRATYIAILFIGIFSAVTTWAIGSATGVAVAKDTAMAHLETGDFVFSLSKQYLGNGLTLVMTILLLVSLFAALMALHNSATRYLYALGRARLLPYRLSKTKANGTPEFASIVQFSFAVIVAGLFALFGMDPISTLVPSMTGLGTLGIVLLQCTAALSIVVYFRKTKDKRYLKTLVAPVIGFIALLNVVVMAFVHFPTMAGSDNPVIGMLPLLLLVAIIFGYFYGYHLKRNRPEIYLKLSEDLDQIDLPQR